MALTELPTFHFNSLSKPPFFLQSILPQRLAQIKRIQLCYHTRTMTRICNQSTRHSIELQRQHKLQQCNSCNLDLWLDTIRKTMINLESIEMYLYLDILGRVPTTEDGWISRLFKLQRGPNGLRTLRIQLFFDRHRRTLPLNIIPGFPPLPPAPPQVAQLERLEESLQKMVRKGAESPSRERPAEGISGSSPA